MGGCECWRLGRQSAVHCPVAVYQLELARDRCGDELRVDRDSAPLIPPLSPSLLQIPYAIVFTKADKRKKGVPGAEQNMADFRQQLLSNGLQVPPCLITSTKKAQGREAVLRHIAHMRAAFKQTGAEDGPRQ